MGDDNRRCIWAIWLSPFASNGSTRIGTGQGGALAALFDLVTANLVGRFKGRPGLTAYVHVDMKRPVRPVPGVFRLDAWVEREEGRKVFVKACLTDGESAGMQ